ncbi:OLC1v1000831C1 [Oldenlandia corymbosa var. corymbosa]|uniref:OLC1v1000831C1 n=1 Tax=Oldenlandia corymbosa var. corymbosa TaxID=529605 RepID=A0AAV1D5F2_OLDCO|nr:OLC1v1000831C1 [Oldenlandia corymbosa var. corymbosa]
MGGQSSKSSRKYRNPYANANTNSNSNSYLNQSKVYSERQAQQTPAPTQSTVEKKPQSHQQEELEDLSSAGLRGGGGYGSSDDEFYDGIPRFRRSSSQKSRSRRAKVSEKAADIFDSLGNSMANLNPGSGFVSRGAAKSNELSILAFEVANTIVKGANILQSLSRKSIRLLKEGVLPSEGVQKLVSTDTDELLTIVAADKREELRIFAAEVVRFGNRCKDPQWHNLDIFFKKHSREPQKLTWEEAEFTMHELMILVQNTAELYQELHALDRLKQEYQHKRLEACISSSLSKGNTPASLATELKTQTKLVKSLKKKSLWSRSLEEVMGKLVDTVLFLNQEINNVFKNSVDNSTPVVQLVGSERKLGPSGLALHYANIILLIDSIVARSSSLPQHARETLYQNLPPSLKSPLRSKLRSFHVKEQLNTTEIKAEMEKTLQWLVPIATNTAKAHHGFGWVGEWANTGSGSNRQSDTSSDVIQIETLHHADRQKTEAYILELLLWLNHLVSQSKVGDANDGKRESIKKVPSPNKETNEGSISQNDDSSSVNLSADGQNMKQDISNERPIEGTSNSKDSDNAERKTSH